MKAKHILYAIIGLYALSSVGIYVGTNMYLEHKRNVLRQEAYEGIDYFFSKQKMFVNVGFSGEKVAYEQTEVPKYHSLGSTFENQLKQEWQEQYGDIYKMYKLKPKYTSENEWDSDRRWSGWLLYIIESNGWGRFKEYKLYPYQVGFRKQTDSWMYSYMPSVQTAVNEAFEFLTTNPKSSYSQYITKQGVSCYDVMHEVENEYYKLFSYDDLVERHGEKYADSIMVWSPWDKGDQNYISVSKAKDQISGKN